MPGSFSLKKFLDIDLNDPFFDSLKADYPVGGKVKPFEVWFPEKAQQGRTALVFDDENGIGAFVCIKYETESIVLQDQVLPRKERCKITTMKIAERFRGQRLGEGAIGLVLWKWKDSGLDDIYVTAFDKHDLLITQLTKFGFIKVGYNPNGEGVYLRSRSSVDYSDPYKSFPFINPHFKSAGYLCVNDYYHDTLFPYSELKNTLQTSFCIVTNVIAAKRNGKFLLNFNELLARIGNKSVYDERELRTKYDNDKNMFVVELLYYGYFGEGHNINMDTLENKGYWSSSHGGVYPALIRLTPGEFKQILREGNINVNNVIID